MAWNLEFLLGSPGGSVVKNPPANAEDTGRHGFDPWIRKIPWSRKWQPVLLTLPGKSHGESVVGYTSRGHKESDMAEQLSTAHTQQTYTGREVIQRDRIRIP